MKVQYLARTVVSYIVPEVPTLVVITNNLYVILIRVSPLVFLFAVMLIQVLHSTGLA